MVYNQKDTAVVLLHLLPDRETAVTLHDRTVSESVNSCGIQPERHSNSVTPLTA